ncbi:hypothetical protein GLA29479_127 [Lysobacter antibioticus]|nr:hypothetical protein GLA29479_127 [Lysobacter antibioticus]
MKNGTHPCVPPSGSSVAFASANLRTATAQWNLTVAVAVAVAVAEILICFAALPVKWRPGGRRTGRAPFSDKTGTSYRKIPARASHWWLVPLQGEPFSLVSFLLGLAKESNPAASADGSPALA